MISIAQFTKSILNSYKTETRYIGIIFLTTVIICFANYTFGTWLSGWDTLHPEMDYQIYWERILNSVWQDHQGLGAVATQAHASEIPRVILMQSLFFLFPIILHRWLYVFLMLIIGPLGVYFLVRKLSQGSKYSNDVAFIGALAYLMNLGTLQHFYAPLEMFVTLFGFSGWIFFSIQRLFEKLSLQRWIVFGLFIFFSGSIAHTPTLWFVNFLMIFLVLATHSVLSIKNHFWKVLFTSTTILILIVSINLYWILPTAYFTLNHANDVSSAKITRLVSEEGILNNQEYANIADIAILKGYLFNWKIHIGNQEYQSIFFEWEKYFGRTPFVIVGYVFFIFACLGVIFATIRRFPNFAQFIPLFIVPIFFLKMDTPPFGFVFSSIYNYFPLLKEALRFPFTKFSLPLMLANAIFISGFFLMIFWTSEKIHLKLRSFIVPLVSVLFVIYFLPAFLGNLIGRTERVKIPTAYFEAYKFLNKYDDVRIAELPINSMFGWVHHDWVIDDKVDASYEGAGFKWFLSRNPLLNREFDRWYPTNEDFFNEFQYAVNSEDIKLLVYVLKKYDANYIFVDKSITSPGSMNVVDVKSIESKIKESTDFQLVYSKDFITIYQLRFGSDSTGLVYTPSLYSKTGQTYSEVTSDSYFYNNVYGSQNFIKHEDASISYPFFENDAFKLVNDNKISINYPFTEPTTQKEIFVEAKLYNDELPIEVMSSDGKIQYRNVAPAIKANDGTVLYDGGFYYEREVGDYEYMFYGNKLIEPNTSVVMFGDTSSAEVTLLESSKQAPLNLSTNIYSAEPSDCLGGQGGYGKTIGKYEGSVILNTLDKNTCLKLGSEINIDGNTLVEISFDVKTTAGARGLYCIYGEDGKCINDKFQKAPNRSDNFVRYKDYVLFRTFVSGLSFDLINESLDKSLEQEVEFRDIKLTFYKIIKDIPIEMIEDNSDISLKVDISDFPLQVILPDQINLSKSFYPNVYDFNSKPMNCDRYNNGTVDRVLNTDSQNSFTYSSIDSISCDTLKLTGFDSRLSYLLDIKTENITGKGLDVCFYAPSIEKCIYMDRLKSNSRIVLPSLNQDLHPVLNIGNQSIGAIPTENKLYGVEFSYVPYKFLKSLRISDNLESINSVVLKNFIKEKKYKYRVGVTAVTNVPSSTGLIILDQSFENGWGLYEKSSCRFGIESTFTCKKADSEHVLAKNWANGWLVPSKDAEYLIIFWPQYLQFIGYGFLAFGLILTTLVVFVKRVSRR